jgi:hypothetical protein
MGQKSSIKIEATSLNGNFRKGKTTGGKTRPSFINVYAIQSG